MQISTCAWLLRKVHPRLAVVAGRSASFFWSIDPTPVDDTPLIHRERLLRREMVLQQGPHPVGHQHHADLALLVEGAAFALQPQLALLPEDVLRREVAKLAAAEPGVEQGPDHQALGGRLARVGELVGLLGREGLTDVVVGISPPNRASSGSENATTALFVDEATQTVGASGRGSRPGKQGVFVVFGPQGWRARVRVSGRMAHSRSAWPG